LLAALAADGVKPVVIEKLDRFTRNLLVLVNFTQPDLLKNDAGRKFNATDFRSPCQCFFRPIGWIHPARKSANRTPTLTQTVRGDSLAAC
jgi:hypothetical protein